MTRLHMLPIIQVLWVCAGLGELWDVLEESLAAIYAH